MPDSQDLLRNTIRAHAALVDPHGNLISSDHPDWGAAFRKLCAELHRALDEELEKLTPEQLRSPEELQKALRKTFDQSKPNYTFDIGNGNLTLHNLEQTKGKLGLKGTLPVYKVAAILAATLSALKLKEWLTLPVVKRKTRPILVSPIDGLEYVSIPPREFLMGAVPGDRDALNDEKPQHHVTITKGFWLGRTPITVAAYKRFAQEMGNEMPEAPWSNRGWGKEDHPIVSVTWDEANAYCKWAGGRLPSEAEWEYAARGGKEGLKYPWGNDITHENANYGREVEKGTTSVVGSYPANGFGLYDMAGNVWEWVADWYEENYYASSPARDPKGPLAGQERVLRGGSWSNGPRNLRASVRGRNRPEVGSGNIGFRCTREVSP